MAKNGVNLLSLANLQQNEDTIAAIVENLQLGRLDDCVRLYASLQSNLIAMATELDNFPTEDSDAYQNLDAFPDRIMRDDALEQFLPFSEMTLPPAPLVPGCTDCTGHNPEMASVSALSCRKVKLHSAPGAHLSDEHQLELLKASLVIRARHIHQRLKPTNQPAKPKRTYQPWTKEENYTVQLAIHHMGNFYKRIQTLLPHRNESQVRHKVQKLLSKEETLPTLEELLASPPSGYIPPPELAHFFMTPSGGTEGQTTTIPAANPTSIPAPTSTSFSGTSAATDTSSKLLSDLEHVHLVERQSRHDFPLLLAAAQNLSLEPKDMVVDTSTHAVDTLMINEALLSQLTTPSAPPAPSAVSSAAALAALSASTTAATAILGTSGVPTAIFVAPHGLTLAPHTVLPHHHPLTSTETTTTSTSLLPSIETLQQQSRQLSALEAQSASAVAPLTADLHTLLSHQPLLQPATTSTLNHNQPQLQQREKQQREIQAKATLALDNERRREELHRHHEQMIHKVSNKIQQDSLPPPVTSMPPPPSSSTSTTTTAARPPPFARQGLMRLKQQQQQAQQQQQQLQHHQQQPSLAALSSPAHLSQPLLLPQPSQQTQHQSGVHRSSGTSTVNAPASPTDDLYLRPLLESPTPQVRANPTAKKKATQKTAAAQQGARSAALAMETLAPPPVPTTTTQTNKKASSGTSSTKKKSSTATSTSSASSSSSTPAITATATTDPSRTFGEIFARNIQRGFAAASSMGDDKPTTTTTKGKATATGGKAKSKARTASAPTSDPVESLPPGFVTVHAEEDSLLLTESAGELQGIVLGEELSFL